MAHQRPLEDYILPLPLNPTAVAIDKDKHSQYAVRWAIEHLLNEDQPLILIHVKIRNSNNHHDGKPGASSSDADMQQLFTPYRGYCARKSIELVEVVLEDADVSKSIVDYISSNFISNMVLGTGARSFIKNFKKSDVGNNVLKSAPEFCSVFMIQKGKVVSMKSAQRPIINTTTPPKLPCTFPQLLPPPTGHTDQGTLKHVFDNTNVGTSSRRSNVNCKFSPTSLTIADGYELSKEAQSTSVKYPLLVEEKEQHVGFGSIDTTLDFSLPDANRDEQWRESTSPDIEAEMRQLRQELKQTMELYSTACRVAISAKLKAKELKQARLAEEEAMVIIEKEKAKSKAAMEAAEAAQRLAEMEAQRRIIAEVKAKREKEDKELALTALALQDTRYRKYNIDEIEEATKKLNPSLKIGEGGYGPVYKGMLDHTPVAIKVLRPDASQGMKQFQQEVEVLSCMRHPNMVLLLGACPENGCLVYEYMNNGSLEDRLYRRGNTPSIPWKIRVKISTEIVTALTFLHQAKPEPLVHRDLKPANILIDQNYVSKISDVGLACLVPPSVSQCRMTAAAGTFCYIDPEYQQSGMLTTKSDVYSLGIMLLQIITARPPMGLTHQVQKAIDTGSFETVLDPTVLDWPVEEVLRFAKMALKCSELRKKDRPDLATEVLPELIRLQELAGDSTPVGFGC